MVLLKDLKLIKLMILEKIIDDAIKDIDKK